MLFPHWEAHKFYDFGTPNDQEWLVKEILAHAWNKNQLSFQVYWNLGNTTWKPYEACKDLQALNDYLQLFGVVDPYSLPQKIGSYMSHNPN